MTQNDEDEYDPHRGKAILLDSFRTEPEQMPDPPSFKANSAVKLADGAHDSSGRFHDEDEESKVLGSANQHHSH